MNNQQQADAGKMGDPLLVTGLYMVLFYVVYLVLGYLLFGIGLSQLLVKLLSGAPQAELQKFGATLARYMAQIVEYIAMRSDEKPYPFSPWPDEPGTETDAASSAQKQDA